MSKVIAYEPPLPIMIEGTAYTIQAAIWLRFRHKRRNKPYHEFHRHRRFPHNRT